MLGTISAFAFRQTQGNQEKPVSRWPVAGRSECWLLASSPASKVKYSKTPILQQYSQNDNSTLKASIQIHTSQLAAHHVITANIELNGADPTWRQIGATVRATLPTVTWSGVTEVLMRFVYLHMHRKSFRPTLTPKSSYAFWFSTVTRVDSRLN